MEKIKPILSVIVPVYNVEPYLSRCVDSILSQSFTNLELILVDDGSTDRSGNICDEWAIKDHRVKVFHKPNAGVNTARNKGLDIAHGDYITFVDGDDFIKPDTFSRAIELLEQNDEIDILQYPEIHVHDNKETLWNGYPQNHLLISNNREKIKALIGSTPIIPGGLCGKVYRENVWENLRLRGDMRFCEDMIIMPDLFEHCRSIACINEGGYCYVMRTGSATKSTYTPEKCLDVSRLKMKLWKVAIKYNIDQARWWNEATSSAIDAWTAFGPFPEIRESLIELQSCKSHMFDSGVSKQILWLAHKFSPLFAARINRAIVRLRTKFNH
mgnify:CR=1 FL=1